jgi:lipopolysaccharide export system protein LptA
MTRSIFFSLLLLLIVSAAPADERFRTAPAKLRADRIEINQKTGESRYLGHVEINQDTLRVTADRASVRQQAGLVEHIRFEGQPATFRDKPEGQDQFIEGEARRIDYEALHRRAHLYDNVKIRRGADLLQSGTVHYNMNTQAVTAESSGGQRVIVVLDPKHTTPPTGAPKQ